MSQEDIEILIDNDNKIIANQNLQIGIEKQHLAAERREFRSEAAGTAAEVSKFLNLKCLVLVSYILLLLYIVDLPPNYPGWPLHLCQKRRSFLWIRIASSGYSATGAHTSSYPDC